MAEYSSKTPLSSALLFCKDSGYLTKTVDISLVGAFQASGPGDLFNIPLSQVAVSQLVELAGNLNSLTLSEDNDI